MNLEEKKEINKIKYKINEIKNNPNGQAYKTYMEGKLMSARTVDRWLSSHFPVKLDEGSTLSPQLFRLDTNNFMTNIQDGIP